MNIYQGRFPSVQGVSYEYNSNALSWSWNAAVNGGTSGIMSKQAEEKAHQPYSPSQPDADDSYPEDNGIIDVVTALSDTIFEPKQSLTLSISADRDFLNLLCKGYETDPWTKSLLLVAHSIQGLKKQDDLWFLNDRLIVPNARHLQETVRVSPVTLRFGSEMDPCQRDLTNILLSCLVSDSFGPMLGARAWSCKTTDDYLGLSQLLILRKPSEGDVSGCHPDF